MGARPPWWDGGTSAVVATEEHRPTAHRTEHTEEVTDTRTAPNRTPNRQPNRTEPPAEPHRTRCPLVVRSLRARCALRAAVATSMGAAVAELHVAGQIRPGHLAD